VRTYRSLPDPVREVERSSADQFWRGFSRGLAVT
jgi:hypothetical protein